MVIFYKNYPYAPKATMLSVMASVLALLALIGGIFCFSEVPGSVAMLVPGLLLVALAVFLFIYGSRKLPDKLAKAETEKNIRTKPRVAATFCRQNPDMYETVRQMNPAFAEKYTRNEKGKIVKRK